MIKLGFTGSRYGLNQKQKDQIILLLNTYKNMGLKIEIHHGDCLGADADFHDLCFKFMPETNIIIHPPIDNKLRAYCHSEQIKPEKDYLSRNRDIVDESEVVIACPLSNQEELRSGTWATIRYARKQNKKLIIIAKE